MLKMLSNMNKTRQGMDVRESEEYLIEGGYCLNHFLCKCSSNTG